jgi:hypothetical protein
LRADLLEDRLEEVEGREDVIARCCSALRAYSSSIEWSPGAHTAGPLNDRRALLASCSTSGRSAAR